MFTSWNPSGTAVYLESYDFGAAESATDLNSLSNSLNETEHSLAWNVYPFRGEPYISILTGYRSLKMGVQNCHNTAGPL